MWDVSAGVDMNGDTAQGSSDGEPEEHGSGLDECSAVFQGSADMNRSIGGGESEGLPEGGSP